MPDCVPEVKNRSQPRLSLILSNDVRFDGTATSNYGRQGLFVFFEQALQALFELSEQACIEDDAVLDHFAKSGLKLASWKRVEGG